MKDAGFNLCINGYRKSKQPMSQYEAQERVNMSDQEVDCAGDQTFPSFQLEQDKSNQVVR